MWTKILPERRWIVAGCAALLILGAVAAVLQLPGYRPRDVLLRRLESRVVELPAPEVLPHLRRMTALGDDGVAAVARLLASNDPDIAEAAELALSEEIDRWRRLPVEMSAPRAIHLASELANLKVPDSPASRRYATDLGMRLLLCPAVDGAQAEELVTYCERVLIAGGTTGTTRIEPMPVHHASESPQTSSLPRR